VAIGIALLSGRTIILQTAAAAYSQNVRVSDCGA
jgi:hypothetical protein